MDTALILRANPSKTFPLAFLFFLLSTESFVELSSNYRDVVINHIRQTVLSIPINFKLSA